MDIESKLNEFRPVVGFVCPAEFWAALGYEGTARYVAVYWEQCGDEAAWCDGRSSMVGADWPAYMKLIDHNFPLGHPARWLLGGSDIAATMWLIVDRVTEWGWLAPAEEGWAVLRMQYPDEASPAMTMTMEELLAALDGALEQVNLGRRNGHGLAEGAIVDFAEVMARQYERDAAFEAALRGRREITN